MSQISALQVQAEELHVQLEVNKRLLNIKIVGRRSDVYQMSDYVTKALKDIDKEQVEMNNEKLLARSVQWQYREDDKWLDFDPAANKVAMK